jgi:hypothetical protein
VLACGLRFGSDPDLLRWILLCWAQIAAVGMTTTALWVASVDAFLAVCKERKTRPLDGELKGELKKRFVEDIRKLEGLISRDLSIRLGGS